MKRARALAAVGAAAWLLAATAAEPADRQAYDAAMRSFAAGAFQRAATEFGEFGARFPNSPLGPEAARRALFARGEAESGRGDHAAAAGTFAAYQAEHGASEQAGDAAVREAAAALRLGDAARAAAVLGRDDGPFRRALRARRGPAVLLAGLSLATEAHLALKDTAAARRAAAEAEPFATGPGERWERRRLEARVNEAAGDPAAAVASAEALVALCQDPALAARRPESAALLGRLLLDAGQPDRAAAALEPNLAPEIPVAYRTDAAERLADLAVRRGELARARDLLERPLAAEPESPAAPGLRLRLGQVLFRQYRAARGTNGPGAEAAALLALASAQAGLAASNAPAGLRGSVALLRGWCGWEEALIAASRPAMTNALRAFAEAAAAPAAGPERAVARYKAADAAAWLGDPATALAGYLEVAEGPAEDPGVRDELVPAALEQAVVAAVASSNAPAGERALRRLMAMPAASGGAGRGVLLLGTALARDGAGDSGRGLLREFSARFPESPLRAEAELELATLSLEEERWTNAVTDLREWLAAHTNHPGAVRAGFHLAYALARSGDPAAAMEQFSALAARHPDNPDSITAQLWMAGDFFARQDYLRAGQACAAILTNAAVRTAGGATWHKAKLWAAEAGRRLQNFDSSAEHFRELLDDASAPPEIQAAAYFHYGEMLLERPAAPGAEPLSGFRLALEAFSRVPGYTNSPYATPALGMMANCHFQLGASNPANYPRAAELYRRAAGAPDAGVETRVRAWLGLAEVTRRLAEEAGAAGGLWDQAVNLYQDVAFGKLLRPGERLPPSALADAARSGGELLERLGRIREALGLYELAAREMPAAPDAWLGRARRVREALASRQP